MADGSDRTFKSDAMLHNVEVQKLSPATWCNTYNALHIGLCLVVAAAQSTYRVVQVHH